MPLHPELARGTCQQHYVTPEQEYPLAASLNLDQHYFTGAARLLMLRG